MSCHVTTPFTASVLRSRNTWCFARTGWDGSNANVDFINWCLLQRWGLAMNAMADAVCLMQMIRREQCEKLLADAKVH